MRGLMAFFVSLFIVSTASSTNKYAPLRVNYYRKQCPRAEDVIQQAVVNLTSKHPRIAASLLRLNFHDCFIRGCDASILLDSCNHSKAEKDSALNHLVTGYQAINQVKAAIEQVCPGVVSCADVLAVATRDAVHYIGGPCWVVPTGRRDGLISRAADAVGNIPQPSANYSALVSTFAKKGFTASELVTLSGSHTIGTTHCSTINSRLYNFSGTGLPDPTMNPGYITQLMQSCKPGDGKTEVGMDGTQLKFDVNYFNMVQQGKGMFQSDAALMGGVKYVKESTNNATFFRRFANAMTKLGMIGVLTGKHGEIRVNCARVNNGFVLIDKIDQLTS